MSRISLGTVSILKAQAGWPTLSHFSIDESTLADNTTPLRQRRGTDFAFAVAPTLCGFQSVGV
jgi:hypothetical protein